MRGSGAPSRMLVELLPLGFTLLGAEREEPAKRGLVVGVAGVEHLSEHGSWIGGQRGARIAVRASGRPSGASPRSPRTRESRSRARRAHRPRASRAYVRRL